MDVSAAERLLEKLRTFVAEGLDPEERALFGQLLAAGVAQAYAEHEVEGFVMTEWSAHALPQMLVSALRSQRIRVVGLDP